MKVNPSPMDATGFDFIEDLMDSNPWVREGLERNIKLMLMNIPCNPKLLPEGMLYGMLTGAMSVGIDIGRQLGAKK